MASNIGVRGYANLLFHRGIYEWKAAGDVIDLMHIRDSCAAIYIEGKMAFPDLPFYTRAIIWMPDGSMETILGQNRN